MNRKWGGAEVQKSNLGLGNRGRGGVQRRPPKRGEKW